MYSTGNYIQYLSINYNTKNLKKNTYISVYIYVYVHIHIHTKHGE